MPHQVTVTITREFTSKEEADNYLNQIKARLSKEEGDLNQDKVRQWHDAKMNSRL